MSLCDTGLYQPSKPLPLSKRRPWIGRLLLAGVSSLVSIPAYAAFPGVIATSFGADPSGETDAAPAINACLAAAGHGGVCFATGGKFRLAQDVAIPANTTLACGSAYAGRDNYKSYGRKLVTG